MKSKYDRYCAAVVQASSVIFDLEASIAKAISLLREAVQNQARLVVFPEAFLPAYPRGFSFGMVVGSRDDDGRLLWERYWNNSIDVPGPVTNQIGGVVAELGIYLVMGVIEREHGSLYCTSLYFGPDGRLLGKHRKLKPTGAERMIWSEGDASTLTAVDTPLGTLGGLICWENYMPLARMAMYQQGVDVYVAPTADSRDSWQATMRHIACEGRCYVLGCNQYVTKEMYPSDLPPQALRELEQLPQVMCPGGSVIVSPLGDVLAGPLYDEEGILYAEVDPSLLIRARLDFDVMGHYARPDVFRFDVRNLE